jgi:hypothetical protein
VKKLNLHYHLGCSRGGVNIKGGMNSSIIYGRGVCVMDFIMTGRKTSPPPGHQE